LTDSPWPKFHQNNQNTGLYKTNIFADFIADTTNGTVPFTVHFSDSSSGNITNWQWDFGDGNSSTEQNPTHTYEVVDTFTVSLTVTGPSGSDKKTRINYIIVKNPSGVTDKDDSALLAKYELSQNYPNPFNPETNINFTLPYSDIVKIVVFNLNGKVVETLFNGKKESGYHSLKWNASTKPSGVYLIKMQSDTFVKTKKCLLLK